MVSKSCGYLGEVNYRQREQAVQRPCGSKCLACLRSLQEASGGGE